MRTGGKGGRPCGELNMAEMSLRRLASESAAGEGTFQNPWEKKNEGCTSRGVGKPTQNSDREGKTSRGFKDSVL